MFYRSVRLSALVASIYTCNILELQTKCDKREIVQDIDSIYNQFLMKTKTPGVIYAIVHDGKILHLKYQGYANIEKDIKVERDTRFRIASMSKSFTSLAIMKLSEEGKINLDDPIVKHIPMAIKKVSPNQQDITVRDLLRMTPGLPQDDPWADRCLHWSEEQLYNLLNSGKLIHSNKPGNVFEYSNLSYAILGLLITKISGQPYQQYIRNNIFIPLHMNDTTFEYSDVPQNKLAQGYRFNDVLQQYEPQPLLHDGIFGAMGGLVTTVDDYIKYVNFHQEAYASDPNKVLRSIAKASTLLEMHRGHVFDNTLENVKFDPSGNTVLSSVTEGPNKVETTIRIPPNMLFHRKCDKALDELSTRRFYGYGLRRDIIGDKFSVGHAGGIPGYGSEFRMYPKSKLSLISFSNSTYGPCSRVHMILGQTLIRQLENPNSSALDELSEECDISGKEPCVTSIVAARAAELKSIISLQKLSENSNIFAENFYLDQNIEKWNKIISDSVAYLNGVDDNDSQNPVGLTKINNLRGHFLIQGKNKKSLKVFFTLNPMGQIQHLNISVQE
jgi:CubicO group peptidase (beta-lactamase class C family)